MGTTWYVNGRKVSKSEAQEYINITGQDYVTIEQGKNKIGRGTWVKIWKK